LRTFVYFSLDAVASPRKKAVLIAGTVLLLGVVIAAQRMQRAHAIRETAYIQLGNARGTVQTLQTQLEIYRQLNGFYPSTEQGLEAFVTRPTSSPIPQHWTELVFRTRSLIPGVGLWSIARPPRMASTLMTFFLLDPMAWRATMTFARSRRRLTNR
jgi:hypothetical protein